jgi:hypothetical protein
MNALILPFVLARTALVAGLGAAAALSLRPPVRLRTPRR